MAKKIYVPDAELFNEKTLEFITVKGQTISIEHSLVSISKWESIWKKSFINAGKYTPEEYLSYIKCMTITQNVNPRIYDVLTIENLKEIQDYIDDPMTATTFTQEGNRRAHEVITSELIYCWMTMYGIPWECQKWHINRLLTLINVCAIKNGDTKKMSKNQIAAQNSAINAQRRKMLGSKG